MSPDNTAALVEVLDAIRVYAQDLLDNGHLFGAQISGVMAIRDEVDRGLLHPCAEEGER